MSQHSLLLAGSRLIALAVAPHLQESVCFFKLLLFEEGAHFWEQRGVRYLSDLEHRFQANCLWVDLVHFHDLAQELVGKWVKSSGLLSLIFLLLVPALICFPRCEQRLRVERNTNLIGELFVAIFTIWELWIQKGKSRVELLWEGEQTRKSNPSESWSVVSIDCLGDETNSLKNISDVIESSHFSFP